MIQRIVFVLSLVLTAGAGPLAAADDKNGVLLTPAPEEAEVYFITPEDGATVESPFTVRFGLKGMGVAPAGVAQADTGHHHLLINVDQPPKGEPIPSDEQHRHFGGGQTQTTLDLPPGEYSLQLLLGDHRHIPHQPPVASEVIEIRVK